MKFSMLCIYILFAALLSCQVNQKKVSTSCQKARKLTIQREGETIANENYSVVIIADKNNIDSRIDKDSIYYSCLNSTKDFLITVIFKHQTREYRIDSVYKNIFDMPQDAELIFRIDLTPFDVKKYGYSEEILSKKPKEIFSLSINPNEYGIGRRFIGIH